MNLRSRNAGERDLFEQAPVADKKTKKKTEPFLSRIKNRTTYSFENIVPVTIFFIMSCIAAFSLGVEKGRRETDITRGGRQETGGKEKITSIKNIETYKEISTDKYVIQLASFKESGPAREEIETLNKLGYNADMKKSGSYYQVYIGFFDDEKGAQKLRNKLKERYKDCYIKRP